MKNILFILTLALVLAGCKEKSTNPLTPITGSADFTIYVAIGNSVTAGFQSNSLYEEGQKYSYPNLIAGQVNTNFSQSIISEPGIHQYRIFYRGVNTDGWFILDKKYERGEILNADYPLPYNNLGVPGARLKDVLHATNLFTSSGINPFFDIILRNFNNNYGTQFQQAKKLKPTFLTLWIGNNDILGYAMGGAYGSKPISKEIFYTEYKNLVDSLKSLNTECLTANIPDITVLPYFTAIPVSFESNDSLNYYYGQTKSGVKRLVPGSDYICLPAAEFLFDSEGNRTERGQTESDPIPDERVLSQDEVTEIKDIIRDFNNSIETICSNAAFVVVDLYSVFNQFRNADSEGGIQVDGITLKTDFITGGLFSLDGIHPANRGQAVIANEFIKTINKHYNASITLINISHIPDIIQTAALAVLHSHQIPVKK